MISVKYTGRGHKDSIILIPGWATDHRIFEPLDLKFNYLVLVDFSPFNFTENLSRFMKKNQIEKISLFGFSLGGFAAAEFAYKYPDLIDELILVSIRKGYNAKEISEIKNLLKRNKEAYLCKFYEQCFYREEQMRWFKGNLLKIYCEQMDLDHLLKALDYLENAKIKPELLNSIKNIKIIHGECDSIAPVQEAIDISKSLKHAKFISIKNAGHIPFLEKDFGKHI